MTLNNATDWQFPVGDKQYSLSKLFTALAEAQSGYYLLGENQQWHGGIHVDAQVLNQLQLTDKVAVKCMAEGEVVAYRLNDNYLRLEKPDKKVAFYSSGFTLIRHLLQMDYVAPPYSINDKFEVVSGQDSLTHGVHIRRRPRGEFVGYLMNGANITLDIDYQYQSDNGYYWYPLLAINNGYSSIPKLTPIPLSAPPTELAVVGPVASCLGWLSLGRYPLTHNQQIILGQRDKASENQAVQSGLAIYDTHAAGAKMQALLPVGSQLMLSEIDTKQEWGKVACLVGDSYASTPNIKGWVKLAHLRSLSQARVVPKPAQLYLYSLSMHLADFATYQRHQWSLPAYIKTAASQGYQVSDRELDKLQGLNIRAQPKGKILAVLAKGTRVELDLGFKHPAHPNWYAVTALVDGYHTIPRLTEIDYQLPQSNQSERKKILGWIYIKSAPKACHEIDTTEDKHNLSQGLRVRKGPSNKSEIISFLPQGCQINLSDDNQLKRPHYIAINRQDIQANQATHPISEQRVYIWSSSLTKMQGEPLCNQIEVLDKPVKVRAGDIIGYMGHYQSLDEAAPVMEKTLPPADVTPLLHVELFTCDDLPGFIRQTQTWAANLSDNDKPLVLIEQGTPLLIPERQPNGGDEFNPAKLQLSAQQVGYERIIRLSELALLDDTQQKQDEQGNHYWHLSFGSQSGSEVHGWVSDKQPTVKRLSPWQWRDYQSLIEKATPHDFHQHAINKKQQRNQGDYQEIELLNTLSQKIKARHLEESTLPDSLSPAHLKQALKHQWLAERLARIHVNYESEWYAEIKADGTIPKWEIAAESQQELGLIKACLTEETPHAAQHYQQYLINEQGQSEPQANAYLHGLNATRNDRQQKNAVLACIKETESNWQLSQTQIKSLLWWQEVAQKLADKQAKDSDKDAANTASQPATLDPQGRAWFIHPLSFISNFKTQHKALFKLGDKHELIREINIRLAGFGGNVPTDEFTDRTEKMIKQFQRDYMHVAETGIVDMTVIEAMDKFRDDYPIDKFFEQARCVCSTMSNLTEKPCDGFGFSKYSSQKQKESITEQQRQYEYPGIHRTIFWVLRSIMFYIENDNQYQHLIVSYVSSGYRCWVDNHHQKPNKRNSTNHMGKAIDIVILNKGKNKSQHTISERIYCCDLVRDILTDKIGAQYRWTKPNKIALENSRTRFDKKIGLGKEIADVWVHYDVRKFELLYLSDNFFVKTVQDVNGKYMLELL